MRQSESVDLSKRRLFSFRRAPVEQAQEPRVKARPPYAVEESMFTRLCDGCGKCASACPSQIIEMVDGVAALDISYSACDLCGACKSACPTLALSNQTESTGLIATISNSCENLYGYCGSCEDSCPYNALQWQDDAKPKIDAAKCKGCGQCAQSCYNSMISFDLKR
ncbi:4Fe-4S binding protein [Vibrio harveyi]|uniref:4Fe-4S binding protein n=1 Tax=Vibrio harveyi TaxID=669 RepID=UPI003BB775F5